MLFYFPFERIVSCRVCFARCLKLASYSIVLWVSKSAATLENVRAFPWPLEKNSDKDWPQFSASEWTRKGHIILVLLFLTGIIWPWYVITHCDPQPTALWYEAAAFVPDGTPCTAASVIVWRGTDGCSQHKKEIKKEPRVWHHYPAWDLIHWTCGATTSMNLNCRMKEISSEICIWQNSNIYILLQLSS